MKIGDLIRLFFKQSILIILIVFMTTSIAAYLSIFRTTSVYEAHTTLYIISRDYANPQSGINYEDIRINSELIKDYQALIKSNKVTKAVETNLNIPGITANVLKGIVDVSLVGDSNVIQVNVIDTNPIRARDIANVMSTEFINKMKELTNEDNIGIVDYAEVPLSPSGPSHVKNIALGIITGLIIALIVIFLKEELNTRIKSKEIIESEIGLKVLAIIPEQKIK